MREVEIKDEEKSKGKRRSEQRGRRQVLLMFGKVSRVILGLGMINVPEDSSLCGLLAG